MPSRSGRGVAPAPVPAPTSPGASIPALVAAAFKRWARIGAAIAVVWVLAKTGAHVLAYGLLALAGIVVFFKNDSAVLNRWAQFWTG